MLRHKNSFDCPSKVYKCFCQGETDSKRHTYHEIFEHLRTDCPEVMMHCQFCHTACTHPKKAQLAAYSLNDDTLLHHSHTGNTEKTH